MNNYKKFMKNSKAISPIFATLILIAIAVIAGVVVYMFTSGTLATMTNGGTAGQEKVSVQGVSGTTASLTVYAQNQGTNDVKLTSIIVKDSTGAVIDQVAPSGTTGTLPGSASGVALGNVAGAFTKLAINTPYTVTLVSSQGGSFVSSSFTLAA